MKQLRLVRALLLIVITFAVPGYAAELTPEQKQVLADLKQDLGRICQEIEHTTMEEAAYSGGLIKSLIRIRRAVLKTNKVLVEQRIHALETGTRITFVVSATKPDAARAAELSKEIENQRAKVAEARAEAERYSGSLVKAMAETALATNRNTLTLLEQQYLIAMYRLAMPPIPPEARAEAKSKPSAASSPTAPTVGAPSLKRAGDCLKIGTFDAGVLSTNDVFTEISWKVDVSNSCNEAFSVRVTFTIYDKDEFELDSDSEDVYVPAMGTGRARGKMLVSPPDKARRMAKQGASLSLR